MVIVSDTAVDPLWKDLRDLAAEYRIHSCWSVPFLSSTGSVLGSLGIGRPVRGEPDDEQSEVLRTAGVLAGIATEFALDETQFRERGVLLRCLVESSEDPIFAKDLAGRYLLVNAAEERGMRPGPDGVVEGMSDLELFPPDVARVCRRTDEEVLRTGRTVEYEHEFDHPSGKRQRFLIKKSPLLDRQGHRCGVFGIARDVTELRRAEAALRRAQKLEWLGVLAGGIAHDFNNLLTGILGNAELVQALLDEGDPGHAELIEVHRAAGRAAELIAQLSAYAGRAERPREVLALPELVRDMLGLLSSTVARGAELRVEAPEHPLLVDVDATQIGQVVMNLVTNAAEALADGRGRIEVALRSLPRAELPPRALEDVDRGAARFVELRVSDSGEGMDEETLGRIFDPFFSTKFEGRGLGLAAAQGIVAGHGGSIQVESRVAHGTTFRVFLPESQGAPQSAVPAPAAAQDEPAGARVLVADDEPVILSLASSILQRAGFDVVTAADGTEAAELFEREADTFDLVLLDRTMPGLGIDAVLARLHAARADLGVVLTSGHPEVTVRAHLANAEQVTGFLKKPFGPSDLLHAVRTALHGR
jgi:PAS domain S-box-containing protein